MAVGLPERVGRYRLLDPLGSGAMGSVLDAVDEQGRPLAIKLFLEAKAWGEVHRAALQREIRAIARLDHEGIVWLFDHGVWEGPEGSVPWYAMERLSGGPLHLNPPTRWTELAAVLDALLAALAHAHAREVLHLDVKPANILHGSLDDTRPGLKLVDFGIASVSGDERDLVMGTPRYMAPEQFRGDDAALGPWTDLYALGCLIHKLTRGRAPFRHRNPVAMARAHARAPRPKLQPAYPVPAGLQPLVDALMSSSIEGRLRRAADARAWLAELGGTDRSRGDPGGSGPMALGKAAVRDDPSTQPTRAIRGGPAPSTEEVALRRARPIVLGLPPTSASDNVPGRAPTLATFGLRRPRTVGREKVRERLWRAVRHAVRAQGSWLRLVGEAGMGRSHLLAWLRAHAHEAGLFVWPAVPAAGDAPFAALGRSLRRMLGADTRVDVEVALRLRGVDAPEATEAALRLMGEPRALDVALEATVLLVRLLAENRPVLLTIDGCRPETVALAERLVVEDGYCPIALVSTASPDDTEDGRPLNLALQPLAPGDGERLLDSLLPLDHDARQRVVAAASGRPGAMMDVLHRLVGAGALRESEDRVRVTGHVEVPTQGALQRLSAALDGLHDVAWEVAERAAFFGQRVPTTAWIRACDDPDGSYDRAGRSVVDRRRAAARWAVEERLTQAGMARPTREGWMYTSWELVEALRVCARRAGAAAAHHDAVASVLPPGAERAGHWLRGASPERGVDELLEHRRNLAFHLDYAEQDALVSTARNKGLDLADPRRLVLDTWAVELMNVRDEHDAGVQLARQLLPRLGQEPNLEAEVLYAVGRMVQGDAAKADHVRERLDAYLVRHGQRVALAVGRAWFRLGALRQHAGLREDAVTAYRRATEVLMAEGSAEATMFGHYAAALAAQQEQDHEAMAAHGRAMLDTGVPRGEALALSCVAAAAGNLGDYRTALDALRRKLVHDRAARDRTGAAATLSNIAGLYAVLGRDMDALATCAKVRALEVPWLAWSILSVEMHAAVRAGEERVLQEALAMAEAELPTVEFVPGAAAHLAAAIDAAYGEAEQRLRAIQEQHDLLRGA